MHLAIIREINQFEHILKTSPSMLELRDKLGAMIENYSDTNPQCSHHELVRLKLLTKKEYDFCETCLYVRRMR